MSANIYLALAGGLVVGALILGNPFLASPAHASAGDLGAPGSATPSAGEAPAPDSEVVETHRAAVLEVESVELAGERFAVVTWEEDQDGRRLLVLEDGRVVTRAENAEGGFRVVEPDPSTPPRQIEANELRAPLPPGDPDERR